MKHRIFFSLLLVFSFYIAKPFDIDNFHFGGDSHSVFINDNFHYDYPSISIPILYDMKRVVLPDFKNMGLSKEIDAKGFYMSIIFRDLKSSTHDFTYLTKSTGNPIVDLNRVKARKSLYYYTKEGLQELHFKKMEERHMEPWRLRPRE
jgi:hypothetical protein